MISSLIYKGIETMQIELILASLFLARQINAETSNSASYGIMVHNCCANIRQYQTVHLLHEILIEHCPA